ncbi:hypothetical protein [Egbenema bharatensis]|uniref:hypothetical protein n=1 Tax=Egbenema bharatensis TaxID=3463334 RepID=UPI003A88D334
MPTLTQTNLILDLTDRYGVYLDTLSRQQKLFIISCLSEHLRTQSPLEDLFDALDPNALIPNHLTDALSRSIELCPTRKVLETMLYSVMAVLSEG